MRPVIPFLLMLFFFAGFSQAFGADDNFNFFSDQPIADANLVHIDPPKPAWMTIGGPLALLGYFFLMCFLVRWLIPYRETALRFDLHDLPVAAQRGIGMAVIMFGSAFCLGGFEVTYQIGLHGSAVTYFQQMGQGKLIAMSHAHLFGFTTSMFIIGIPFSLHFNRLKLYQWVFPVGLAASTTDVCSWWGIKYVSGNFEYITWWCGIVFASCYLWMLIGLVRVLFFPRVKWFPDFINEDRQRSWDKNQH